MKNFKLLSKAEMKKVSGGSRPFPPCTTEHRSCNIVGSEPWTGTTGVCADFGGGGCGCYNAYLGVGQQSGDCYAE